MRLIVGDGAFVMNGRVGPHEWTGCKPNPNSMYTASNLDTLNNLIAELYGSIPNGGRGCSAVC